MDREGFQRLVTEVGVGKAGIVLGLEVSRLARNSTDWHRLLETVDGVLKYRRETEPQIRNVSGHLGL